MMLSKYAQEAAEGTLRPQRPGSGSQPTPAGLGRYRGSVVWSSGSAFLAPVLTTLFPVVPVFPNIVLRSTALLPLPSIGAARSKAGPRAATKRVKARLRADLQSPIRKGIDAWHGNAVWFPLRWSTRRNFAQMAYATGHLR